MPSALQLPLCDAQSKAMKGRKRGTGQSLMKKDNWMTHRLCCTVSLSHPHARVGNRLCTDGGFEKKDVPAPRSVLYHFSPLTYKRAGVTLTLPRQRLFRHHGRLLWRLSTVASSPELL